MEYGASDGVRQVVLDIIGDLAESHPEKGQKDCLKQIAGINLRALVALLSASTPLKQSLVAARVLGLVSIYRPAQATLGTTSTLGCLVQCCCDVADRMNADVDRAQREGVTTNANLESTMIWVVRTLANVAKRSEFHESFHEVDAVNRLKLFLTFPSELVKLFVARMLVFLGVYDIGGYDILSSELFTRNVDVIWDKASPPANGSLSPSPWADIKGASIEQVVSVLINEQDMAVCHLFFLVFFTYCEPSALFRLLTYSLHGQSGSNSAMTARHDRVLTLVKHWIEHRLSDFMESPTLLQDLKTLIGALQAKGGVYEGIASQLLDMTVDAHPQRLLATGVPNYTSAAHHSLYDAAKKKV